MPAYPWIMLVGVWAAVVLALRMVDNADWSQAGLGDGSWGARSMAAGWLLGATAMLLTAAILFTCGLLRFETVQLPSQVQSTLGQRAFWVEWTATGLRLLLLLAPSALWEELVFRGYLWTVVNDAVGERAPHSGSPASLSARYISQIPEQRLPRSPWWCSRESALASFENERAACRQPGWPISRGTGPWQQ